MGSFHWRFRPCQIPTPWCNFPPSIGLGHIKRSQAYWCVLSLKDLIWTLADVQNGMLGSTGVRRNPTGIHECLVTRHKLEGFESCNLAAAWLTLFSFYLACAISKYALRRVQIYGSLHMFELKLLNALQDSATFFAAFHLVFCQVWLHYLTSKIVIQHQHCKEVCYKAWLVSVTWGISHGCRLTREVPS